METLLAAKASDPKGQWPYPLNRGRDADYLVMEQRGTSVRLVSLSSSEAA